MDIVGIVEISVIVVSVLVMIGMAIHHQRKSKYDRKKSIIGRICLIGILDLVLVGHLSYGAFFEKPVFSMKGEETITLSVNGEYSDPGIVVTRHGKDISELVKINNTVDTSKVGEYTIEYTLPSKRDPIHRTRKVKVIDTMPPELTLKGEADVKISSDKEYKEEGYIAVDNADGDMTEGVTVTTEKIDDKTDKRIYTAEDKSGNKVTKERIIHKVEPVKREETSNKKGVIYLTFDDGPSLDITPKILDILKEEKVKATFFIINYDDKREALVKRIVQEGHAIGIHGYSHDYKTVYSSVDAFMENVKKLEDKILKSTGLHTKITRFPGGSSNTISKHYQQGIMTTLTKKLVNEGYRYYDWNVSSGDAGGAKTKEDVYRSVTKELTLKKANMVLMHDYSKNEKTLNALRDIIRYGKANGHTFAAITMDTPMITQRVNN